MPRLRNALTGVVAGLMLTVLGAGTAAASPSDCPAPPASECPTTVPAGCGAGGLHIDGGLNLGGLLDGVLGGILGGGGCCPADD